METMMMNPIRHPVVFLKAYPSRIRCLSTAVTTTPISSRASNLVLKVKRSTDDELSNLAVILNEYDTQGDGIKVEDVRGLVNYLRDRKEYKAAAQLYDWLETNKHEMISNAGHAMRIDILYKAKGLIFAENYFNSLEAWDKTYKTYGALLNCYCREQVLDMALELYGKMNELGYMTTLSYNNMLNLYICTRQPEKVPPLVEEMEKKGFNANPFTWNLLINSYAAMGNFDAAEGVVEKMKIKNIKVNSFTYGNLATICVNCGLHEKAKPFLELMEKIENEPFKEKFEGFRIRLQLYSEINDLSGVIRAWESLKSAQPSVSNVNYMSMLSALSKLGDKARLEELYQEWEENWTERQKKESYRNFDFRLPNVVMKFYLDQNMISDAAQFYEKVRKRSTKPNLKALNLFSILFVKKSEIDLALDYLEMGIDKSVLKKADWFPPNKTVEIFMKYFEENKDMARVARFVELMKKVSHLDSSVYDSLLSNSGVSEYAN